MNPDITIFGNKKLTFEIELDDDCSSIFIHSETCDVRQFATREQLIKLRDQLIEAFRLETLTPTQVDILKWASMDGQVCG